MDTILIIICVCLTVFSALLLRRYFSLKQNIRRFADELEKLKDSDYRQPVKVTDNDKDIVDLAVKVNEHTDIQRKLCTEYEQSKKRLGTVISGISHDFRTPLTAALGYLQMIEKSGELSDKNAEYLDIVMQKNRYLKELSDEFFELTKLENGAEELHLEKVNLSNTLTAVLLEQHSWIEERGIDTEFDIEDGITADADTHFLARILNNLMSNAQKYTDDRFGVTLVSDEGRVRLCVSNTLARGVSVDTKSVFEPFYRMDSRTAEGSGLGLYVVKLLCGRMGWTVSAEINDNVFSVEICAQKGEAK